MHFNAHAGEGLYRGADVQRIAPQAIELRAHQYVDIGGRLRPCSKIRVQLFLKALRAHDTILRFAHGAEVKFGARAAGTRFGGSMTDD